MKIVNIMYAVCSLYVYMTSANTWEDYGRSWENYGRSWSKPVKPQKPQKVKKHKNHTSKEDFEGSWMGWGSSWAGCGSTTTTKESNQQDIIMNGVISLRDRSLGSLTVNGVVDVQTSSINELLVNGPVSLTDVTVGGKTDINGPLDATKSNFNTIDISTSNINLDSCTVKSIKVRASEPKKQQVILLKDTTVENTIVFEQGNGKVILKGNSVVKGDIVGGTKNKE